jgi:putative membrane-bound dehydrogenase-like protein
VKAIRKLSRALVALATLPSFVQAAETLVTDETLGLRVAPGFRVTLYSDSDLANDIYAMTLDSRGRVVVTSPGWIKTLEDTNGDGKADQATLFGETKTGGMGMCFDGNDLFFTGDGWFSCYRDRDGDGKADGPPDRFFPLRFTEHGGHAMRKGPDGWWYLIGGNDTGFSKQHVTLPNSPIREPEAGCLLRLTPNGRNSEIIAQGLRNPYDFDFNWLGDVFTYDSDVERDFFLPWYTPTRLYHIAPGGHHGWRLEGWQRSWNRPDYYADTVDILLRVGRGSPTGVTCYRHAQFPEHYRDGLFVLDWTFGKVFFFPLEANGTTYRTLPEIFIEPIGTHGFAPTDVAVAPDGSLFISIGGRKTRGAVYRVEYAGDRRAGILPAESLAAKERAQPANPSELAEVLDAPQPLDAWSRERWMPVAKKLGAAPLAQAVTNQTLSVRERIRAVEVLTEMFGGLTKDLIAAASKDDSAQVRTRVAWAIGRLPEGNVALLYLARDPDARVRLGALESLAKQFGRAPLTESANRVDYAGILEDNFAHPDKRVHQAAAHLAATMPEAVWGSADSGRMTPQGSLTRELASIWRSPAAGVQTDAIERLLPILAGTKDNRLRLDTVRLIILALGDWNLRKPSVEVYTAYELARPPDEHASLVRRILSVVRPFFPSGDETLDLETSRLLAMLQDNQAELVPKVTAKFAEDSSPTSDFHYLVVLSRLRSPLRKEVSAQVAGTIVGLERKLQGQELRTKQMWTARLAELVTQFVKRAPEMADALMAQPGFAHASHIDLAAGFGPEQRRRAARLFLNAVKADPNFAWSGALIELLAALPSEEAHPLFRQQWSNLGLRDSILPELAKKPVEEDRARFLGGLDSGQPQVLQSSLAALTKLPKASTAEETLVPMLRLLRRLVAEPKQTQLRAGVTALLTKQTGQSFSVREDATDLKRSYAPVFNWFAREYPLLAGKLEAQMDEDPVKWAQLLKSAAWDKGDAKRGGALFRERACQTCHTGWTSLGPNLGGVTSRFSVEDLFNAIIYPNRDVAPLYRNVRFQMRDGQTHTGLVAFESADGVMVLTGPTTTVRLPDSEIVSREPTTLSLMPTGLLNGLKPEDLADLYGYLKTLTSSNQ